MRRYATAWLVGLGISAACQLILGALLGYPTWMCWVAAMTLCWVAGVEVKAHEKRRQEEVDAHR